jgi:hypothetical protein
MSFYVPDGWNDRQWSTLDLDNDLVMQNNPWGAISPSHLDRPIPRDEWYQAIGINDDGNPAAIFSYPRDYFDPSKVIAFPELIHGNKFGTLDSGAPGYPIAVSDIGQIDIEFNYKMHAHPMRPSDEPVYNVAVETFFDDGGELVGPGNPKHDPRNTQVMFELMVWLESPLDSSDISLGDPIGEITDRHGTTFDLYSFARNYCAFVRREKTSAGNKFCWSDFIAAVNAQPELDNLQPQWQIGAFEAGAEIWTGSGLFEWLDFNVDVSAPLPVTTGDSELFARLATCYRELADTYDAFSRR